MEIIKLYWLHIIGFIDTNFRHGGVHRIGVIWMALHFWSDVFITIWVIKNLLKKIINLKKRKNI